MSKKMYRRRWWFVGELPSLELDRLFVVIWTRNIYFQIWDCGCTHLIPSLTLQPPNLVHCPPDFSKQASHLAILRVGLYLSKCIVGSHEEDCMVTKAMGISFTQKQALKTCHLQIQ